MPRKPKTQSTEEYAKTYAARLAKERRRKREEDKRAPLRKDRLAVVKYTDSKDAPEITSDVYTATRNEWVRFWIDNKTYIDVKIAPDESRAVVVQSSTSGVMVLPRAANSITVICDQ